MLADKTCKRLARGIGRFVLRDPAPFVLRLTQPESGGHVWSVAEPMATQTARYDFALGAPVISKHYGGVVGDRVGRPTGTVTGVDHHSLGMPVLMHNTTGHPGGPVDGSAPTVTTGGQTGLGTPIVMQSSQTGSNGLCSRPANEPAPTQTTCQDLMLGTPVLTPCGGPKREPSRVDEAANTILTREDRGLGLPLMSVYRSQNVGGRVDAPTDGITAGAVHNYIATPLGMQYYGGSQTLHRSDEHLGCVPTVDRHAIATPVMTTVGFGEREGQDARCQAPTAPTNTVVAGGVKQGVVSPVLEVFPAATRERALKTAAFLVEHLGAEAGGGVRLSVEGFAVVVVYGVEYVIVDILFRMLRVRELAAAMGFPADYVWPRTQRDAVKCIGNAVQIDCAEALLASSMPREAEKKRKECAA